MPLKTKLNDILNIEFPLIMAPMFLVSNSDMIKSAMRSGIAGAFPTLNYRNENELELVLDELNKFKTTVSNGTFGVNLIVQKTNPLYEKHLAICVSKKVPFYITSLGNPQKVIDAAHAYGAKVLCDVTNVEHAKKVVACGCDGLIAVGQGAGGHAGPFPLQILIPALQREFPKIPVVAAGGIASGSGLVSVLALGACGASVGTRFIASNECKVGNEYKKAIINSGMQNIALTERLSGTPCTIIDTPYAKKIGYKQSFIERILSRGRTKKWFKTIVQYKGFKKLENSIKPGNYNNLWCAGQSCELIDEILSCDEIISKLKNECYIEFEKLKSKFN